MSEATAVWVGALEEIWNDGHECKPRGKRVKELIGTQVKIPLAFPLPLHRDRQVYLPFAFAEPAWMLSGDYRVSTIKPYAPSIDRWSDDGQTFAGAYGPRLVQQLPFVVKKLKEDWQTREAVISIWRDSPMDSLDYPCLSTIQFMLRRDQGFLQMHVNTFQRSQDAWLGMPYDLSNIGWFAMAVAILLRPPGNNFEPIYMGTLTHSIGSLHLYEKNWIQAINIINKNKEQYHYLYTATIERQPRHYETLDDLIGSLYRTADDLLSKTAFIWSAMPPASGLPLCLNYKTRVDRALGWDWMLECGLVR